MRLPAKVEYACAAALELALRYDGDTPVQISEIAGSQDIPENFLTQIFQRLKAAGLVNSMRGVAGGYYLAKTPDRITLADIVKALDSSILEVSSEADIASGTKGRELILRSWNAVSLSVAEQLEQITLEGFVTKLSANKLMYHI